EAGNGGSGVVIGPQAVSSVISTSIISGNGGNGITAEADGLRITGNHIGTDQDGTAARGNGKAGVVLNGVSGAMVGAPGASNVISGNGADGIVVRGGSSLVTIQANLIGVARDRVTPLGNSPAAPFEGIDIQSATGVIVGGTGAGEGNTITGGGEGISVKPGAEAAILGNSIHGNTNLAVDLGDNPGSPSDGVTDNDPNDGWTNHPTLTRVTASQGIVTVEFDVHDVPGSYRVEFFANPSGRDLSGHGEAEVLIGGVTVDGPGSKYTFSYEGAVGDVISGASTRIRDGVFVSTSEMSLSVEVGQPSAPLSRTLDAR
ncbi:MAG: right-handed parallel beta-helix repeat-containing protein, partial [Acidimicrobiia bacterium]|nr:right-handed parallel beta-helix repeat-containing protein [Acidimicrobiia bacterium]